MKTIFYLPPFLAVPVIGLCIIGIFIISSTVGNLFFQQLLFMAAGAVIFFVASFMDRSFWEKFSGFFYILSVIFLILSIFTPGIRGSHRWIDLGFTSVQPSELIKPFVILFLAKILSSKKIIGISEIFLLTVSFLPVLVIIFRQPDLGNFIIYSIILLSLLICIGIKWRYFIFSAFLFIAVLPLGWNVMKDYQRLRITTFLNPYLDPSGAGYNAMQAVISIGSGQIFGLGLGRGTQSKLLFLPEFHTDFIFASLVEELGFVGGAIVITLYFVLLSYILINAFSAEDMFSRLVTIGVFTQIFIQVMINIGMNLGILPITGITLPLLSYGGSSIIGIFLGLGVVVSLRNGRKKSPLVIK